MYKHTSQMMFESYHESARETAINVGNAYTLESHPSISSSANFFSRMILKVVSSVAFSPFSVLSGT